MPRRHNLDLAQLHVSLNVTCPHCGHSITPDQQMRIDFEHMKCPKCEKLFSAVEKLKDEFGR